MQIASSNQSDKSPIAALAKLLIEAGLSSEQIAQAIDFAQRHALESADNPPTILPDPVTAKRRAYDRERQKIRRHPPTSAESAETPNKEEVLKKVRLAANRLSADWTLPEDCRAWTLREGLTEQEIAGQMERFKDYWGSKAGKDAAKTDWVATWRNWCRKFLEQNPRKHAASQHWSEAIR